MLTGMSAHDLSFLAPYHRISSRPEEQPGRSSLEQKTPDNDARAAESPGSDPKTGGQSPAIKGHQRLVFSDPVAFRYLEEDPGTVVLDRRRRLPGYDLYIVEQWACSRTHPTFIICTYTGDMSRSILVSVLGIPADENSWSPRLKVYFDAVSKFHARKRETALGSLMVTNLSGFPSALTVMAVPDGDIKKHREDFIVNEDLKRLGCSGRAGLNLQHPQATTVAKFHHVYRTSENVPIYASVMELVRLCQTALMMFGKLLPAYADGLLCDITEKAVNDWWTDIGAYFYNLEPSDGILGPTTVAGLLGLYLGAYNRLKATGAPVGKDVLDTSSMKRAIGSFQRIQRLEKTRRLDRQTLEKLHRNTAKTAAGDGWAVPKAVKSTVAELSGKGGEMVMGIVGGRDKAGISEVETLDIDRFSQLVTGSKMKWLWQGKPIKSANDVFGMPTDELNGRVFSSDEQGNFIWTSNKRDSVYDGNLERRLEAAYEQQTGENKSGLGRLRDAVGIPSLKSHHARQIKEEEGEQQEAQTGDGIETPATREHSYEQRPSHDHALRHPGHEARKLGDNSTFSLALATPLEKGNLNRHDTAGSARLSKEDVHRPHPERVLTAESAHSKPRQEMIAMRTELDSAVYQDFSSELRYDEPRSRRLRRSHSAVQLLGLSLDTPRQNRQPRHLSFSAVEGVILTYNDALADSVAEKADDDADLAAVTASQELASLIAHRSAKKILNLQQAAAPYVGHLVDNVEMLDRESGKHLEDLNNLYYQRLEDYQALRARSTDVVGDEKAALTEALRRVEMLGAKLDYELAALQSRVQEVEDGVVEFERKVINIESRIKELTSEEHGGTISWFYEFMRVFGVHRSS